MKHIRRTVGIIGILCLFALTSLYGLDSRSDVNGLQSLILEPSCVPENEGCIPIGGDFFSFFENKQGYVYASSTEYPLKMTDEVLAMKEESPQGYMILNLRHMQLLSKHVYSVDGLVKIKDSQNEQVLAMEHLDYLSDEEDNLYYRISCLPVSGCDDCVSRVYLISAAYDTSTPLLHGTVVYVSADNSVANTSVFSIPGRDPFNAEWHLEKQIARITDLL